MFRRRRSNTYNCVRSTGIVTLNCLNNVVGNTITFNLTTLPNYTEFTNLWDMYRINCVVLKWRFDRQIPSVSDTTPMGYLHYAFDPNDDTATSTINDLTQYGTYNRKALDGQRPFNIKIYPKAQQMLYKSVTTTGYAPKSRMWINTADPNVPHYALKYIVDGNDGVGGGPGDLLVGVITLQVKYYLSFKNIK